jgi:hypothetical protein
VNPEAAVAPQPASLGMFVHPGTGQDAAQQAKQQAQQAAQTKETFKKAWGACLEGRGYSVK